MKDYSQSQHYIGDVFLPPSSGLETTQRTMKKCCVWRWWRGQDCSSQNWIVLYTFFHLILTLKQIFILTLISQCYTLVLDLLIPTTTQGNNGNPLVCTVEVASKQTPYINTTSILLDGNKKIQGSSAIFPLSQEFIDQGQQWLPQYFSQYISFKLFTWCWPNRCTIAEIVGIQCCVMILCDWQDQLYMLTLYMWLFCITASAQSPEQAPCILCSSIQCLDWQKHS